MSRSAAFRHKFYTYLDDAVQRVLEEHGVAEEVRAHCGAAVADGVAEELAGEELYTPYDFGYKLAQREREILDAARRGVPKDELRRRYRMSAKGLARLLKRAATRDPHLDQGKLF